MRDSEVICGPIAESLRAQMAAVIDSAFARSLQPFLPDRDLRLRVVTAGSDLQAAIGAWLRDELVGVIGLKTASAWVFDGMRLGMLHKELGAGALKARLALKVLDRPIEPDTIRIEFLAVEESARGNGVGRALLRAAEQRACVERARLLELHVESENRDARRLYKREGFRDNPARRDPAPRRWLQSQSDI